MSELIKAGGSKLFEIGQTVFMTEYTRQETFVTCPDCLGSRHLLVILGDGSEVTIECGGCDPGGFQPSTGTIQQYIYGSTYREHTVEGAYVSNTEVEYRLSHPDPTCNGSYYTGTPASVFATLEEAVAAGVLNKLEFEAEENKRLMGKTKNEKSWKWNAAYHRKCIKRIEIELKYHWSKVSICDASLRIPAEDKP